MHYLWLLLAILSEVVGTTALKSSHGFTRLVPSLVVAFGYGLAIFFLTLAVQKIPTGVTYAIWSGLGMVFIVFFAWLVHGEKVDTWGCIGFSLILAGVLVLNLLSKTSIHEEEPSPTKSQETLEKP